MSNTRGPEYTLLLSRGSHDIRHNTVYPFVDFQEGHTHTHTHTHTHRHTDTLTHTLTQARCLWLVSTAWLVLFVMAQVSVLC